MKRGIGFAVWMFVFVQLYVAGAAQQLELRNSTTVATFGSKGLLSVRDSASGARLDLAEDGWLLSLGTRTLQGKDAVPKVMSQSATDIVYEYQLSDCRVLVTYRLEPGWHFVSKQLKVEDWPEDRFTVHKVELWNVTLKTEIKSDYQPSVYVPQLGKSIEQSRKDLSGKDYGEFLRFGDNKGAFLLIQNPFLTVHRDSNAVEIAYEPEMEWQQAWGQFETDIGCIGTYGLTGVRMPREMVMEWHLSASTSQQDGMDKAEINAFTTCVREFLISPSPDPISVLVGWTLNDYQIDVGTAEGRAEYKRIMDVASQLGIQTLLYAPGNSQTAERTKSVDTWGWEYVLWLGMGQQIRKATWDPAKDELPESVSEMLNYARQKKVGLLAYVYPSIPYEKESSWIVTEGGRAGANHSGRPEVRYATLASRDLQDYLIKNLIAFKKRTGIAGYSFDYDFLNLPGSSSYSQWFGWRRVIETLRKEYPSIVIDGRQSYQQYGPWSWLAGNYPHPTGTDEQPESFKPFPDLHFDRVSADRTRFVNYWYRNYQFAPEQVIPGYATHQTERSRNLPAVDGRRPRSETIYTRFRPRDWDYLGYKYSFISSIATGGWNNVVDMIPARDLEEARHFSAEDKEWIRNWLEWTVKNKEYLLHTRSILDQPALGNVDGTAALVGDRGFLFLFNPNYEQKSARFILDSSLGLDTGSRFLLREVYPQKGRLLGKPGAGVWNRGDAVQLQLDGTSATVIELQPVSSYGESLLFNAGCETFGSKSTVQISGTKLTIRDLSGEPGTIQNIGVLLPKAIRISDVQVNGRTLPFKQNGSYIQVSVSFAGHRFAQSQEIRLTQNGEGILQGSFLVPRRIFEQLAARRTKWPIPWTQEDYETTWLVPERLLLFFQFAEPNDSMQVSASLDGKPLKLIPAYSSTRVHAPSFVGFYADLSAVTADVRHTIDVRIPEANLRQLQGVYFDNVLPQFTRELAHSQKGELPE